MNEKKVKKQEKTKKKIKKESKSKSFMITEHHYTNQWLSIVSILMFFVSFYGAYFIAELEISLAFVKSCFVLIVANIIFRSLIVFWNIFIPEKEWLLIVNGRPEIDSRSRLKLLEKERIEREEDRLSKLAEVNEDSRYIDDEEFVLS